MKQRSILWQSAGFAFVTFGGTILHFLYDWTGGNILVLPFSGVNESTWEHMKLLFWPLFLFAMVQRQFFNNQENYWCVKLAEILLDNACKYAAGSRHVTLMLRPAGSDGVLTVSSTGETLTPEQLSHLF